MKYPRFPHKIKTLGTTQFFFFSFPTLTNTKLSNIEHDTQSTSGEKCMFRQIFGHEQQYWKNLFSANVSQRGIWWIQNPFKISPIDVKKPKNLIFCSSFNSFYKFSLPIFFWFFQKLTWTLMLNFRWSPIFSPLSWNTNNSIIF